MKIASAESWVEGFELTRPYTIAYRRIASLENVIVRIRTSCGWTGLGTASPGLCITGESFESCRAALAQGRLDWLLGRDVRKLPALCRELRDRMPGAPAAQAAVDIALHDLLAQKLEVPLVEMLGRAHSALPTSITIGIQPADEALAEAEEYLGRGFRVLKVKVGLSVEEDIERLVRLREKVGPEIRIRVDANQGYSADEVLRFFRETASLDLEFLEQPMKADAVEQGRELPEWIRCRIAADESLLDEADALRLSASPRPCGIFNIKLMKCGGIRPAMQIASIGEAARLELMWGCMDESAISITAALHAALACPATRYLDLDGSLDLARDVVEGGFILKDGLMRASDAPGLGLRLRTD